MSPPTVGGPGIGLALDQGPMEPRLSLHLITSGSQRGELAFSLFSGAIDLTQTAYPHRPGLIDHPICLVEMLLDAVPRLRSVRDEIRLEARCSTDFLTVRVSGERDLAFHVPVLLEENDPAEAPCARIERTVFVAQLLEELERAIADQDLAIDTVVRQDFVKHLHRLTFHARRETHYRIRPETHVASNRLLQTDSANHLILR